MTPEMISKISVWRARARAGELTKDELKEFVSMIRKEREGAGAVSAKARATRSAATAKKNINSDDLLGELEGL